MTSVLDRGERDGHMGVPLRAGRPADGLVVGTSELTHWTGKGVRIVRWLRFLAKSVS